MPPVLRPMTLADAPPAADAVRVDGWGERDAFFRFSAGYERAWPVIAEDDGDIVGTGVATANGSVGWVGTIWVRTTHRGRGLGRDLTAWVIDRLTEAGCTSLVLVATDLGRPLYERFGFAIQTRYRMFEGPEGGVAALPPAAAERDPAKRRIRDAVPADLDAMIALDADASGEDRSGLLRGLTRPGTGRVVVGGDGIVRGFLVRPPWRGGVTVAPDPDDGVALLEDRRSRTDGRLRTGLPFENEVGHRLLVARGWEVTGEQVRMVRGPEPPWRPEALWGQFNYALG